MSLQLANGQRPKGSGCFFGHLANQLKVLTLNMKNKNNSRILGLSLSQSYTCGITRTSKKACKSWHELPRRFGAPVK
jgi:hypothetical protein